MKMEWFIYALIAPFFAAVMILLSKKANLMGAKDILIVFYIFLFVTMFFLIQFALTKQSIVLRNQILLIIFIAAIASYFANILIFKSVFMAPNPGYTMAISDIRVLIILFASVYLFGSEITPIHLLGVALTLVGVVLLSFK